MKDFEIIEQTKRSLKFSFIQRSGRPCTVNCAYDSDQDLIFMLEDLHKTLPLIIEELKKNEKS